MGSAAMAQGLGAKPDAVNIESSFKGVVVTANSVGLTAKGEFNLPSLPANKAAGSATSRSSSRSVRFLIKDAKITRGWHPCEPKDIHKGETVTITYTKSTQGRPKYVATRVDIADESSAEKQSIFGKPGKVLFEDDFSRSQLPPKWRPGKGFWEIHDGVVTAAENPDDHHGAYAYAEPRFPYKDIVAEFSFKFDGSTGCHFMMEDSNYKGSHAGHIIRATITPTSAILADSKFGSMKNEVHDKMIDPQTTAAEKQQIQASIKDKAATFKITLDASKWHQARVEVIGDEMLLSIDNRPVGYLKSEGVDHPTKNMVGFTIAGKSTQLDNVKVWDATIRDDWSEVRSTVLAALQKQ
jgi:hypothetical protein